MAELNQDFNGKWKITGLKHDHPGVTIPATFRYNGSSVNLSITSSEQTYTFPDAWKTPIGVAIRIGDIQRTYQRVTQDGTTYETTDNFTSSSVHPVTGAVYSLEVSGPNTLAGDASANYTATLILKVNGTLRASQDVTNDATWRVVSGPGTISGHRVTNTNDTGSDKTIKIEAKYNSDGISATGTKNITAESGGGGGDTPMIRIIYTGNQVAATSGRTSSFTITSENATVTGYTVDHGASIQSSGTSSVTVEYPANQSESQTVTYTVVARGKDSNNNLVSGSTTFTQKMDNNYEFRLSPSETTAESTQVSKSFTVTAINVTGVGYAASMSTGLTGGTANSTSATAKFSQNESSSPSVKTFAISAKTETQRVVYATATITQSGVESQYYIRLSNPEDEDAFVNVPCSGFGTKTINLLINLPAGTDWYAVADDEAAWINITKNSDNVVVSFEDNNEGGGVRTSQITICDTIGQYEHVELQVKQNACGQPSYSLEVTVADGYSTTIDSTGSTKLNAIYYDGLGGSTAVTSDAEWQVTSGAGYVNIITETDPLTVEGRGNASGIDQKSKVQARFNGLTDDIIITILMDPVIPPYLSLANPSDINHFQNVPCTGLGEYEIEIDSNIAWAARLNDIDDEYWLHISYDTEKVTVSISQNTDPYSGEGGDPRSDSFIIEPIDQSLEVDPITITVSQGACDDLFNIMDKSAFHFTCDGDESYTRNIVAWDNVEWHITPEFGFYQQTEWFKVEPTSGVGDGSFTVTILENNYDKDVRGSGYLKFSTGSTQTELDWDINVRQDPTPFFEITGATAHLPSEGGNVTVVVSTNEPITATTTDSSWIKNLEIGENIRQVGGTAYTEVSFTIENNSSRDGREGSILIESTYDGPCGPLGDKTIQVIQDGAASESASFIHVRKTTEQPTQLHQEIEFGISEAAASTTEIPFIIHADGKCKLDSITAPCGDTLTIKMVNGDIELEIPVGGTFSLIGSATFKAVYGAPWAREKVFSVRFEVEDPHWPIHSDEKVTIDIRQEREYPIGVENAHFVSVGPQTVPSTSTCCDDLLTYMSLLIEAEIVYNSGRHEPSSEPIDTYIKREGNLSGVDDEKLTLTVTNNPSGAYKYCYILDDELHGGNYAATVENPYRIEFSENTGHTPCEEGHEYDEGFRRDVNFHIKYEDDRNSIEEDFTVRVPYCYIPTGEQDVYILSGGSHYEEVSINVGVNENVEIQVGGLVIGETRLSFDCDGSITTSILDNFEIQYEFFDPYSPANEWVTRDTTQPIISFTRRSPYAFTLYIDCLRNGYEDVRLIVEFDDV